ncbi:hypothetical protein N0V85_010003, partial [Neurospora sp. IMI 360204]
MGYGDFVSEVQKHPKVMFMEMKARALAMLAYQKQQEEVFAIAHRLDRTMADLHDWIMHFKELYAEAPEKSDKTRPRTTIENDEDDRSDERTAHPE